MIIIKDVIVRKVKGKMKGQKEIRTVFYAYDAIIIADDIQRLLYTVEIEFKLCQQ